MNDRLHQLKRQERPNEKEEDIEAQLNQNKNRSVNISNPLSQFFAQVESIKHNIALIQQYTENVQKLTDQGLRVIASEEEQIAQQANSIFSEASQVINETKNILKSILTETERIKQSGQTNIPEIRARENTYNQLVKKFLDFSKEYQQAQNRYKTDMKKKAY